MKKWIVRLLIVAVVLLVIIVVAVGLFLDTAVKKGVEAVAPTITKTDVKLDGVSISMLTGGGNIKGLVIGNPEGYKAPNAISVGKASLSVSPMSVLSDKIVIKSVRVESPEITFEGGLTKNNLKQILDNVQAATGGGGTAAAPSTEKSASKKLQVDDFLIKDAKVHVSLMGKTATLPLPDIHFTNLGSGPEGITAGDLTKKVLSEVIDGTLKAVAKNATALGKDALNATEGVGKTATESVGKATKGITDLFKKKPGQ